MKAKQILIALALLIGTKTFAQSTCPCLMPLDTSFHVVQFSGYSGPDYRNDDGSSASINLPFTFHLYNNSFNSLYINNNGNVSFFTSYGTFSSSAFPSSNYVMVAPFWADVDTRGTGSGLVYYKITPTALIVRWQQVGYFTNQVDKLNDFQLIITDGSNADLPDNYNVQFCYGDMQWTTGSASGGNNGFGGTPATVGVNMGNGVDFWQVGRFDHAGVDFDGPYGTNDGVSWLDDKVFYANTSFSPDTTDPIVISTNLCDTVFVPVYNPEGFEFFVIPQFPGYNLSLNVDTMGISGFDYQITNGPNNNYSSVIGTMVGTPTHLGNNELVINLNYENPELRSTFSKQYRYHFYVSNCPLNPDSFTVTGFNVENSDTTLCANEVAVLHAIGNYKFVWLNDNSIGNTYNIDPQPPGFYTVKVAAIDTVTNCSVLKTINIKFELCSGLNEIASANITLYPNPASNNLQWKAATGTDIKNGQLQVFNATGQLVFSKNITNVVEDIQLTGLPAGIYYLKTNLNQGVKVSPFVKIDN